MPVKVTLQDGKPNSVEGSPEEVAAFLHRMNSSATPPSAGTRQNNGTRQQDDEDMENTAEPVAIEQIMDYIESLPDCRHTMTNILMHFTGDTMPSRTPDGRSNTRYGRWVAAAKEARRRIEEKHATQFNLIEEGKKRIYELPRVKS